MTTISIALAPYNGSRFFDQQPQTLASQERLPDELVGTDDASTERTVAKIEAFAAIAPFPVYRNAERLGYHANFMCAPGLCRSAFTLLTDLCLELPAGYRLSAARARLIPRRSSA
jgi:hypothetical protein